jgi:hypothetical protein
MKLKQVPVSPTLYSVMSANGCTQIKSFEAGELTVLQSLDTVPFQSLEVPLLHVSIAHPGRYPTWDEIHVIKEELFGERQAMMILPEKALYVNMHKNCFHLWEMPFRWEAM